MTSGSGGQTGRQFWTCFGLIAAVALVVALPSIGNGFVYDDIWIVERNDLVHEFRLGDLLPAPFWPQARGGGMWRPLALVGFAAQWALGDGRPIAFHGVNIVLYAVVSGLVAGVFARIFSPTTGLIAGALFAVHPMHVEVTANVVGQTELIAAVGYLAVLGGVWERSGESTPARRSFWLLFVAAALAVSLGGKEYGITVPAALLVLWWVRSVRDNAPLINVVRREWVVLAVSLVAIVGYLALRARFAEGMTAAGGIATGLDRESLFARAVVMLPISLHWLRLLFFPINLSADYSPMHVVPEPAAGLLHSFALLIWIALFAIAWLQRRTRPHVAAGIALFAISISIVSNVAVPTEVLLAERLLFFPSVGWALAMGGLLAPLVVTATNRRRLLMATLGLALLAALTARSWSRARVWSDNDVFFAQLMKDAPDSFRSHWAVGWRAFERGDTLLGERALRRAVALNPDHPQLLEDLGRRYASADLYAPAIPLLRRAVELDSARLSSALPLALGLARSGATEGAVEVLDAMSRLHGETRGVALVRGEALLLSGAFEDAYRVLEGLIATEPRSWQVRALAADAAARGGRCDAALAQADTALRMAPVAAHEGIKATRDGVAKGNAPCK